MRIIIRCTQMILFFAITLISAGCGVKSSPSHPEGVTYPQFYPSQKSGLRKSDTVRKNKSDSKKTLESEIFNEYPNRQY